ncbi:TolC family protein [Membranihabitans maritimus]|uniref:TolC family protein n=1 Tax=Membranihabitans maritimus TaxID=2904244 RepID=UPI001F291295|nr:TolC family protein [Membranihabitans maritimus]
MKFTKLLSVFILITVLSQSLKAQEHTIKLDQADSLTLDDIIEFAIQHNPDVRNSQLDQLSNNASIKEITSQGMPQISASGNYNNNYALPQQILPGEIIGQPGTTVPVKFGVQNSITTSVQLNQMVYNPSFWVGLEAAKTSKTLYELSTFKTKEELVYNIIQAYYQIQITEEQIAILLRNLGTMDRLIDIAEVQYEEGIIKKLDVDQLKVNKINLDSEIQSSSLGLVQLKNHLKYLMGVPQSKEINLKRDQLSVSDFAQKNELNLETNTDLRLINIQKELNELEIKNIQAGYIPSVSFFANYGWQGQTDRLFSKEEQYDIVGSGTGSFGVSVNIPIFDSFQKKHQKQQVVIEKHKLENNRIKTEYATTMAYKNAREKLDVNLNLVATQKQNMELAQNLYDVSALSFKEGVAPLTELINAETSLRQSQTQYLSALLQVALAKLDLIKSSGSLPNKINQQYNTF